MYFVKYFYANDWTACYPGITHTVYEVVCHDRWICELFLLHFLNDLSSALCIQPVVECVINDSIWQQAIGVCRLDCVVTLSFPV